MLCGPVLLLPRAAVSSLSSSPPPFAAGSVVLCLSECMPDIFSAPASSTLISSHTHGLNLHMVCPRFPASRAPFTPSFSLPYISIRSSVHTLLDPSANPVSPPPAPLTPRHMPLYAPASFHSNPNRDPRASRYLLTKPYLVRVSSASRASHGTYPAKACSIASRRTPLDMYPRRSANSNVGMPQTRCFSPRVQQPTLRSSCRRRRVQWDPISVHVSMYIL
ncbi:hypothetical protein C8R44DRAFT_869319 [Mycena epipterygia]|nr:hypothetical protein C8R44DRAFT_869319 [Mycena epipterygia]